MAEDLPAVADDAIAFRQPNFNLDSLGFGNSARLSWHGWKGFVTW